MRGVSILYAGLHPEGRKGFFREFENKSEMGLIDESFLRETVKYYQKSVWATT